MSPFHSIPEPCARNKTQVNYYRTCQPTASALWVFSSEEGRGLSLTSTVMRFSSAVAFLVHLAGVLAPSVWFDLKGQFFYSFLECDMGWPSYMRGREFPVWWERDGTAWCLESPQTLKTSLSGRRIGHTNIKIHGLAHLMEERWAGLLPREGREMASTQERSVDIRYATRRILWSPAHFQHEGEAHVHSYAERFAWVQPSHRRGASVRRPHQVPNLHSGKQNEGRRSGKDGDVVLFASLDRLPERVWARRHTAK